MHSNKIAFALIIGMMMTSTWAESAPASTTTVQEKTVTQPVSSSEPKTEVGVEDIDAPILE